MRFSLAALALLATLPYIDAFAPSRTLVVRDVKGKGHLKVLAEPEVATTTSVETSEEPAEEPKHTINGESNKPSLDLDTIARLTFRELQRENKARGLPATGNTAKLRGQLRDLVGGWTPKVVAGESEKTVITDKDLCELDINFCDESDKDFEFNDLLQQIKDKSSVGHWKSATRKLKVLKNRYATPERPVPQEALETLLRVCCKDRCHGARASETARKTIEDMVELKYFIPPDLANTAIQSAIGRGPNGTHEGFGGIDTALAILAALESSSETSAIANVDSYGKVVHALTSDGAIDEALLLLRAMVVEHSFTPPLQTFADVARAAAYDDANAEKVLNVLAFAKAAGYELDRIASTHDGRTVLASGVIAAEKLNNLALGLRLLTAAASAEGCAPDRGDDLVASSSSAAQRACTLIHRRAINKAAQDNSWKLAVKLLTLMIERSLTPSPSVWRSVVTCCAKSKKSRRATALLLDWAKLANKGEAEKPPLSIFNTVINACEICGEEELTLLVLEAMKKTHETEGDIITTNIALKRFAKLGNEAGCEGLIIGMLQAGLEPNVVSYTTAIGACATEPKNPKVAYEWLKRMRSRNVKPNFHTYNTALAACLDGKLESTILGSQIATEMIEAVQSELVEGLKGSADLKSTLPDTYTKFLGRELRKQLRENWRSGDIDMKEAKATIRVPLLKLVDFEKSEAAKEAKKQEEAKAFERKRKQKEDEEDSTEATSRDELELEYQAVKNIHRVAEV